MCDDLLKSAQHRLAKSSAKFVDNAATTSAMRPFFYGDEGGANHSAVAMLPPCF